MKGDGEGWRVSRKLEWFDEKNRYVHAWKVKFVLRANYSREQRAEKEGRRDFKIQDKSYFSLILRPPPPPAATSSATLLPLFRPCCVTAFGLATVVIT